MKFYTGGVKNLGFFLGGGGSFGVFRLRTKMAASQVGNPSRP